MDDDYVSGPGSNNERTGGDLYRCRGERGQQLDDDDLSGARGDDERASILMYGSCCECRK